ncbi:hypothetical protein GCM10027037_35880 [Mucilaginibacter koreensis]
MKKITTKQAPVNIHHMYEFLQHHLNKNFAKQRQQDIEFDIKEADDNAIEISKPGMYEGNLFRIEGRGNELHIHKTEDYTDDVNVLTLEDILNNLFFDYPGPKTMTNISDES